MNLNINNAPTTLWDNFSDTAYPALLALGYSKWTDGVDTKNVIYENGQPRAVDDGWTLVQNFPPNCGFSDTGNTIDLINGDTGLQALYDYYGITSPATHAQLLAVDWDSIPEVDIRVEIQNNIIKNLAAEPYEPVIYLGAIVTYLGDKVTYLKQHLIP